jgi:hypothetical protein
MVLRRKLKWIAIAIAVIFIGLQFTTPRHTNPPVDGAQTLVALTAPPADVSAVFDRSCKDCHSNETNWRWYTYVAPVSWFTVGHVNEGRKELNVSEWGRYGKRMKDTRLKAICAQVRGGTMPLASYASVHRDTKVSPDEVKKICDWTEDIRKQLAP